MKQPYNTAIFFGSIEAFSKKHLVVLIAFCVAFFKPDAQNDYSYLHSIAAMDFTRTQYFDFQGTSIEVYHYHTLLSADIIKDAKKQNGISRKSEPILQTGFAEFPFIYSEAKTLEGIHQKVTTVFLYDKDSVATYIAFHGWKKDTALYKQFLSAYTNGMLTSGLYTSRTHADSIRFLDRKIILGSACTWMAPRSVQCEDRGQMNWSVHPNLTNAEEAADFQYYYTKNEFPMKLIYEENVPLLFEGVPTTAKKVMWKVKGFQGYLAKEMDGSNKLIVYYIATEINGTYIHCVLSHWDNDPVNESGLPALLSEVITLIPTTQEE